MSRDALLIPSVITYPYCHFQGTVKRKREFARHDPETYSLSGLFIC